MITDRSFQVAFKAITLGMIAEESFSWGTNIAMCCKQKINKGQSILCRK